MDLTDGEIFPKLIRFALPILLGTIVTQLYHVADTIIVGQFISSDALAAVSAGAPIISIITLFMIGMSSGTSVVTAQLSGAKNHAALQEAVGTIAWITLIGSVTISTIGLLLCKPLLIYLGTPTAILDDTFSYLMVIFLFNTGNMVYQMGNGILQGIGDSTWPFIFLLICAALNVLLDLAAVLVWHMGVWGVALATGISQLISGIGVLVRLNSGGYGISLTPQQIRLSKAQVNKVLTIGLPAAIQNVGNTVAALFVQSSVNYFGASMIAANSIVTKVEDLARIPVMALSTALCTFVAQNMGLMRMDRIQKGIHYSIVSLTATGIATCGMLLLLRGEFPKLFTQKQEVLAFSSEGLLIMSLVCVFQGVDRCLVNAMRGAGKSVVPMITALVGAFFRIPLAYYLGVCRNDYHGIFYALLTAAFLRTVAIAVYYYCGGWNRVVSSFERKILDE